MTRYDLFRQVENLSKMEKTGKYMYNKFMPSGRLAETHHDYSTGFYDVCIYYIHHPSDGKHYCRVWFGTIDDGDYGSWTECKTKKKAVALVERVKDKFDTMTVLPEHTELNKEFREFSIYFCHE